MTKIVAIGIAVTSRVLENRTIHDSIFILRFERHDLQFRTGQYIEIGFPKETDSREYSIYSGTDENFLEVLIRKVDYGALSPRFAALRPGDYVEVSGPFGFFTLPDKQQNGNNYFIATGTGIAPFHNWITSVVDTSGSTIFHGVRTTGEAAELRTYADLNYHLCVSGELNGKAQSKTQQENNDKMINIVNGRVTDHLVEYQFEPSDRFFLCGNSAMIFDVYDLLASKGVSSSQIMTEVYF